ncbi:prps2 [Symbiodinium necroappetens]|uniref:ribose-phosphate diphosphokinase n=1 Tax=Symbiodinium necroappetens TaxID=1628268 RepID=A0A813BM09_9DINO|nr:prps2 [Symbiodinium necroappetens]
MASSDDDGDLDDDLDADESYQAIRIPLGHPPVVFGLPGSDQLLQKVISHLQWRSGECHFAMFDNGEIGPKVLQTVTNHDVFVIIVRNDAASEVNFSLVRLLLLVDALRGESPHRLTVVMPCLEYARQDRKLMAGEAIAPKLMFRCIKTAGAERFLTVDLHNQAEAAFSPPGMVLDELSSDRYLADFIRQNVPGFDEEHSLVCATNGGGMKFTRRMADILRVGFIMADRFRQKAGGRGEVKIMFDAEMQSINDVIIIDDMFDTCGNLVEVSRALHTLLPSARLYGVAPHGYFSGDTADKVKQLVEECNLQWVAVTNSVDQTAALQRFAAAGLEERIKVIEISKLLAGAILRLHLGAPVNVPKFRSLGPQDDDPVLLDASHNKASERSAELRKRLSST